MDDDGYGENLPLTGAGAMYIDEALRSLSECTTAPCRTRDDVLALLKQSNTLRDTMLTGRMGDPQQLQMYMTKFVEVGGIRVIVEVLQNCLKAECQLQWAADESFGTQGLMRTFYLLEMIGSPHHMGAWHSASKEDKTAAISLVIRLMEEAMKDRFIDVRMQDCYNVVKCLQDLACANSETANMFLSCCGFSNLSALVNWPHPEMRHSRWAGVVVLKDAVTMALPLDKVLEWPVAADSVQAISCLIEALYQFSLQGRHFLYESSVEGILQVLKHLSQSSTYLAIITGVVEIHQAGNFLFQNVQSRVKETSIKAMAISVGLACFPEGLEEPESLGCRRKSMLRFFGGKAEPQEGYTPLPTC